MTIQNFVQKRELEWEKRVECVYCKYLGFNVKNEFDLTKQEKGVSCATITGFARI